MSSAPKPTGTQFTVDDDAIKKVVPFSLVTTNLKGAYAVPAPPDTFDPKTASVAELVKNGVLLRRPAASDPPELTAAWNQVFSRKWLAKDRIIPQSVPQIGKTHLPKNLRRQSNSSWLNGAWAGGVIDTGSWTSALGYWVIPTVSKPTEPQGTEGGWNSASWVGIDGWNDPSVSSNDVLQAGIEQRVDANGNASYVAWYEWFAPPQSNSPGYIWQTNITNFPVSPGQTVYCSVQYVNGKSGYISFGDEATGLHFSITLAPPPGANFKGNTIEWIMESPDGGEPTSALPKFTPVKFTSAIGCGPNNAVGNPQSADTVNVDTTGGKIITSVALASFAVTVDFTG
jgi:Peptidase A4 family